MRDTREFWFYRRASECGIEASIVKRHNEHTIDQDGLALVVLVAHIGDLAQREFRFLEESTFLIKLVTVS